MSIRDIAKAVERSKSTAHVFLKSPSTYGTKKSTGQLRQLKTHDLMRLKGYDATGEYSASELRKELCVNTSVRTVQRVIQNCEHLEYVKANKTPRMTNLLKMTVCAACGVATSSPKLNSIASSPFFLDNRHTKQRVEWVERRLRERTDWSRVVLSNEKKFNLDGPDGCNYD